MAKPEKRLYGRGWSGRTGIPEDKALCIESVPDDLRFPTFYQCKKKRGHGPKGEYCRVHDPAAVAARQAERSRKFMAPFERERKQAMELIHLREIMKAAQDFHNEHHRDLGVCYPLCVLRTLLAKEI